MNMMILLCIVLLFVNSAVAKTGAISYNPKFGIFYMSRIESDLNKIDEYFSAANDQRFLDAKKQYVEGESDLSVAHLTFEYPLPEEIQVDSEISGKSISGNEISGKLYDENGGKKGDKRLRFQYDTTNGSLKCQIGNNLIADDTPSGCLERSGVLIVQNKNFPYKYDPFTENDKGVTLQSFSTAAGRDFYDCKTCPYDDYIKFRKYYGSNAYADDRITAAFNGASTNFVRGNSDFALNSPIGRGEAVKKSIIFMSIWMAIIGKMESAIGLCNPYDCRVPNDCNAESVHTWDEAVTLYNFIYTEAETRCKEFNTCTRGHGETSINDDIGNLFRMAQKDITNARCNMLMDYKKRIVQLMTVPLVQSTLRYAYINNYQVINGPDQERAQAEGATYAASVVPMLHFCEENNEQPQLDAQLIYEQMTVGPHETNFIEVKKAFERNYKCLGISCTDIGGIYDEEAKSYLHNAHPCLDVLEQDLGLITVKITLFVLLGVFGLVLAITCGFLPCRRRRLVKRRQDQGSMEKDGLANAKDDDANIEIISLSEDKNLI